MPQPLLRIQPPQLTAPRVMRYSRNSTLVIRIKMWKITPRPILKRPMGYLRSFGTLSAPPVLLVVEAGGGCASHPAKHAATHSADNTGSYSANYGQGNGSDGGPTEPSRHCSSSSTAYCAQGALCYTSSSDTVGLISQRDQQASIRGGRIEEIHHIPSRVRSGFR